MRQIDNQGVVNDRVLTNFGPLCTFNISAPPLDTATPIPVKHRYFGDWWTFTSKDYFGHILLRTRTDCYILAPGKKLQHRHYSQRPEFPKR